MTHHTFFFILWTLKKFGETMKYNDGMSVIIPTYNRVQYLYGTLYFLLHQNTNQKFSYEIIIIDSGNDSTELLVKQFQQNSNIHIGYKRIKLSKNRSLLRNIGARLARYDNICFLDNDILVSPNFIETCYIKIKNNENLILLGSRKSLTNFSIENINIDTLSKNFDLLENLSYYNDERNKTYCSIEPWRFVFSHTLCIKKNVFKKVRGFNKKFGNHWGFEDLELGFRLQLNKCNICFTPDITTYHQPHFSQSFTEQTKMKINGYQFLKLHNCFEVELYQCFYSNFNKYYPILLELQKKITCPTKKQQKKYDLIFGCIFNSKNPQISKKMFLGAINYNKTNSKSKILIANSFFFLPQIIQQSIITESFRIGKKIYIESTDDEKIKLVNFVALQSGLIVNSIIKDNKTIFTKINQTKSNIIIIYIPNIYEIEKRFIFLSLALTLIKQGFYVNIKDPYNTEKFCYDDFSFSTDNRNLIESNLNISYGQTNARFIIPASMLENKLHTGLPNNENLYIINDSDYDDSNCFKETQYYNHALNFDNTIFSLLTFSSVYSYTKNIPLVDSKINNHYCCFMENGFYEDGIDIILKTFAILKQTQNNITLTIKTADYTEFTKVAFPLHNFESKNAKLFSKTQTANYEKNLLNTQIKKLNLEENIIVKSENTEFTNIVHLINQHNCLIFTSRGIRISPVVYASILLHKKTIICSHHNLIGNLEKFCSIAESQKKTFHKELHIPSTDKNIMKKVNSTDAENLLKAINNNISKDIKKETINDLIKTAKNLFQKFF